MLDKLILDISIISDWYQFAEILSYSSWNIESKLLIKGAPLQRHLLADVHQNCVSILFHNKYIVYQVWCNSVPLQLRYLKQALPALLQSHLLADVHRNFINIKSHHKYLVYQVWCNSMPDQLQYKIKCPEIREKCGKAATPVERYTPKSNQHQIISSCNWIKNLINFRSLVLELQYPQNLETYMQTDRQTDNF